jgi:threonyl-tRNA synthetase
MSCPCHIQVFNQGLKSYRDLPLRFAEFGCCHRNEFSGTLHGLMRVRNFVQDDGHIFCTEDQIQQETHSFILLLKEVYQDFGFSDILVRLSLRPEKRVGTDELWDKAESALDQAIKAAGLEYQAVPNEGAFYGPKIDFSLKDCLGRQWQLGTLQLDYCTPERLGAEYVGEDSQKHAPVMLHRAIYGSFERFIGVLIEHYAGHMSEVARRLGIGRSTLYRKLREYGIEAASLNSSNDAADNAAVRRAATRPSAKSTAHARAARTISRASP